MLKPQKKYIIKQVIKDYQHNQQPKKDNQTVNTIKIIQQIKEIRSILHEALINKKLDEITEKVKEIEKTLKIKQDE
jgi:hypothetical protein